MKKLFIVFAVVCCMNGIGSALQSETTVASAKPKSEAAKDDPPPKKTGIEVPPEKARPITVPKAAIGVTIDGRVDEDAWKQAAVFKDFYQTNPGDNIAPSQPTEARVGYDSKTLYIAFRAYDDPTKVR